MVTHVCTCMYIELYLKIEKERKRLTMHTAWYKHGVGLEKLFEGLLATANPQRVDFNYACTCGLNVFFELVTFFNLSLVKNQKLLNYWQQIHLVVTCQVLSIWHILSSSQIMEYYFEERLHILQCVKFLLSYWQDPRHPYRVSPLSTTLKFS